MRITNPAARELARRFRRLCGNWILPEEIEGFIATEDFETGYRGWVRQRLRESLFFTQLSAGMSSLPDIREKVQPFLRPVEEMYYPRSLRAMVPHLARNLEWYLDPSGEPKLPARLALQLVLFFVWFGMAMTFVYGVYTRSSALMQLGSLPLCLLLISFLLGRGSLCAGEPSGSEKFQVNAAELYRYLLELHTDDAL